MMKDKRVLFFGRKMVRSGGVESYMMNLASNLNKELPLDILITDETEEEKEYLGEIKQTFEDIYRIPSHKDNLFKHILKVFKISKRYRNGIVHIHSSDGFHAIDGIISKLAGVDTVIYHSHNASFEKSIGKYFGRFLYQIAGDYYLGCSKEAGKYLFGDRIVNSKKFSVAKNAVDIDTFKFDYQKRISFREEFNIPLEDKLLGFVGRFSPEKNVDFIIKVFSKLLMTNPDTKLMLVGDGEDRSIFESIAKRLRVENQIIFTGVRDDIDSVMSGLDILLLPSDFESLGIVLIEGQTSGLHCIASTNVSSEANISNRLSYIDLNEDEWVDKIKSINVNADRVNSYINAQKKGYSANDSALKMLNLYRTLLNKS